jgi:AraC-like DNA-binding protein
MLSITPTESSSPDFLSKQVNESDYFFLDLRPDPAKSFVVTCGGLEYCNLNYRIERRKFEYYGLEYIVSGMCNLTLHKKEYQLKAGSIFCYGPRTHHKIENTGDSQLVKFFVDFTGPEVRDVIGEPFFETLRPFQMPNLRSMHEMFHQLLEAGKDGGRGSQRILRLILQLISAQVQHKAVNLEEYTSQSYTTYERCLSFIEQNYLQISSVSDLARECHVSTGYMSRIFKKYAEESPSEMLMRMKLNRAGELLLREHLLIKEVADQIGYEDPYHFSRLFKHYYGMSPKHFRESVKRDHA